MNTPKKGDWWMIRAHTGRFLIHLGLRVLPPGRTRDELHGMIERWGISVRTAVRSGTQPTVH